MRAAQTLAAPCEDYTMSTLTSSGRAAARSLALGAALVGLVAGCQALGGGGGVMPAWGARLDPTTIKSLTVYVHSLGGGQ